MGEVVRLLRRRARTRAKKRIRKLWEEGSIQFAQPHAIQRLEERGLDANDIQNIIRNGKVTHGGASYFPDTPRRFILEGPAVDGEIVVCVVDINHSLVVVTAYPKE